METGSFRDALGHELLLMAREYDSLVVVTPDLAKSVRIGRFKEAYPNRFVSVGVSEADCIGVAAGLATTGLIPVVAAFAMFAVEKPFEQIRNAVAYPCLNVKIFATHGGICVGRDGVTHQAIEDIVIMRALPNMTVITAADANETRAAVKAALRHVGPVYLRLGRDQAETVYHKEPEFILGRADTLRDGSDVTVIACGLMVAEALKAAVMLEQQGIGTRVVNMHSIKPIDESTILKAASETGALVTAEDHTRIGGLGGAVAEVVAKACPVPLEQVAVDDRFGESGSGAELYEKYGLTAECIVSAAKRAMTRRDCLRRHYAGER